MGWKAVAAIAFLVAPVLVVVQAADTRVEYSAIQYLKNFALSACIAQGYAADEVVKDSRAAAGGYLELGSFSLEASMEAAALAKTFLARENEGKHGDKLTLMKCIDLFHSKELDQLARKHSKK